MNSLKEFEIVKCIGRGSFGRALLVKHIGTQQDLVLKEIALKELSHKAQREAQNEVLVMSKLDHANVVKYFGSFLEDDVLYIVMEYCELGDLSQLISFDECEEKDLLDEDLIHDYFTQVRGTLHCELSFVICIYALGLSFHCFLILSSLL